MPHGQRRVVELFAGVGGFRLGLKKSGWQVIWSNQWEPSTKTQHASLCYETHFKTGTHVNADISAIAKAAEDDPDLIPEHELLCGGFPCQDYSVAKALGDARGLEGKKGVLWWDIERILRAKRPPLVFLENVDRLLKSPADQRGRDFAIMLSCFAQLGYAVEWRVVNAADYGFPQRRRRVFIIARSTIAGDTDPYQAVHHSGVLAKALPVRSDPSTAIEAPRSVSDDLLELSNSFGRGLKVSPFGSGGFMMNFKFTTFSVEARPWSPRPPRVLADVLLPTDDVSNEFFLRADQLGAWRRLKGAKRETRTSRSGFTYTYNEGALAFPDPLDRPSRTILTGEGGTSPSRFKHVVETSDGRLRRLMPEELERLNGFPVGWTDTGMSESRRAFMMGNALVVGLVERVGKTLDQMAETLLP